MDAKNVSLYASSMAKMLTELVIQGKRDQAITLSKSIIEVSSRYSTFVQDCLLSALIERFDEEKINASKDNFSDIALQCKRDMITALNRSESPKNSCTQN